MKIQVFRYITLHRRALPNVQKNTVPSLSSVQVSKKTPRVLKMNAQHCSRMLGNTNQVMQHHFPEGTDLQKTAMET